jgi:hypothetical protein
MLGNPLRANRTPNRFVGALNVFVAHLLPHFTTERKAMSVTVEKNGSAPKTEEMDCDDDDLTALSAMKAKPKAPPAKLKPLAPPAKLKQGVRGAPFDRSAMFKAPPGWVQPTGPPQASDPVYCWSHGCKGHPSEKCESMKRGHQDSAVYRNQMGGVPA